MRSARQILRCLPVFLLGGFSAAEEPAYFTIEVVDADTGRGVPLVELETVHAARWVTDSNGIVAFREPGLMDQTVFFFVKSHGYEFPKDGFGMAGTALKVSPGGSARIAMKRINVAERLYRVTGGGIYRDSLLLGLPVPLRRPVLDGLVVGQDSVLTLVHGRRIYWLWGDTSRPAYPLGNFQVSGATSRLPGDGGLDPEVGVDLEYFVDERGFSREMAPIPGVGPTWLDGLVALRDDEGRERMYAAYAKIRPGSLEVHERGIVVFDDGRETFEKVASFPLDAPVFPSGHPLEAKVGATGYLYFASPFPLTRVRATPGSYRDVSSYEAFTCLKAGSRLSDPEVDRGPDGRARYAWRVGAPALQPLEEEKLVRAGKLKREESWIHLQDADSGKTVLAHAGSVYWNEHRGRWVLITVEQSGSSFLGEVWFAEADTPLGPWALARKVVTHERYSFYNPKQHPMLAKEKGRIIFFEGTYANTFSGNPERTPRYDYNQILYKLDLADERLALPVPIYRLNGRDGRARLGTAAALRSLEAAGRLGAGMDDARVTFLALDRPRRGAVPVCAEAGGEGPLRLKVGDPGGRAPDAEILFHALPASTESRPPTATPLYEFTSEDGSRREYGTGEEPPAPGLRRAASPLCLVWANPTRAEIAWFRLESDQPTGDRP